MLFQAYTVHLPLAQKVSKNVKKNKSTFLMLQTSLAPQGGRLPLRLNFGGIFDNGLRKNYT